MRQIVNRVVRAHLPWAPHVKMISVHRREVPDLAEAAWILFACENPTDVAVVAKMAQDKNLRAIVQAHLAKRSLNVADSGR